MRRRWLPKAALLTGTGTVVVSAGWALNQFPKGQNSLEPSALRTNEKREHFLPEVRFQTLPRQNDHLDSAPPVRTSLSTPDAPSILRPARKADGHQISKDSSQPSGNLLSTEKFDKEVIAKLEPHFLAEKPGEQILRSATPKAVSQSCSGETSERSTAGANAQIGVCEPVERHIAVADANQMSGKATQSGLPASTDDNVLELVEPTISANPVDSVLPENEVAPGLCDIKIERTDHQLCQDTGSVKDQMPFLTVKSPATSSVPADGEALISRRQATQPVAKKVNSTPTQSTAASDKVELESPPLDDLAVSPSPIGATAHSSTLPVPQFGHLAPDLEKSDASCSGSCSTVATPATVHAPNLSRANSEPGSLGVTLLSDDAPKFSPNDELVLSLKTSSGDIDEIITAYGSRLGVYVPIGEVARILDLAVKISDEGHYVSGWIVSPGRAIALNLRSGEWQLGGQTLDLPRGALVSFEGEAYAKAEVLPKILPVAVKVDLRDQAIIITPTETLPFQARRQRERERERLASQNRSRTKEQLPFEPSSWKMVSLPLSDIEVRAVADDTFGMRTELELRSAADLAFLTARTFLEVTSRDGVTGARLELGRKDPFARLLGPLKATQFAFGDVANVSQPIGFRSVAGRGVTISNAPIDESSVFDRLDLRGPLPDGYEVELYRNNILVGSSKSAINGQYEFLQVPLDYGVNVLRLVFFGPQGQTREEVRRFNVGSGRIPQGSLTYSFSTVQKDWPLFDARPPSFVPSENDGQWRVASNIAYGLSSKVTVAAGLSAAWGGEDKFPTWLANLGIRTELHGLPLRVDAATQEGGGYGLRTALAAKLGSLSLAGSHAEYRDGLLDETQAFEGAALRRTTSLDVNGLVRAPFGQLPLTARISRVEFEDSRTVSTAYLRTSLNLGTTLLSPSLEYVSSTSRQSGSNRLVAGFDLALFPSQKTRLRLSANADFLPRPAFGQVSAQLDHSLSPRDSFRLTAAHSMQFGQTQVGGAYNRRFKNFVLSADASLGFPSKSYYVGLRLSAGLFKSPFRSAMQFTRPGVTSGGLLAFRAFKDLNADGQFNTGELPVPGIAVQAGGQGTDADRDGVGYLYGLGDSTRTVYQIDQNTTPDIFSAAAKEGAMFVPRAGSIHSVDIPVVSLSEVEGTALVQTRFGTKGISGLLLELANEKSGERRTSKTRAGGAFAFEGVQPGRYRLNISSEQAEQFGIAVSPGNEIDIAGESDVYRTEILFTKLE